MIYRVAGGNIVQLCNILNNSFLSFPVNFLSFSAHFLPQTISDIALLSSPGGMGARELSSEFVATALVTVQAASFSATPMQTDPLHHRDSPPFPAAQLRGKFRLCQGARQTAMNAHLGERDGERKGVSERNLSLLCVYTSRPEEGLIKADTH